MINITKKTRGELALFLASLMWGLTFPFVRIIIQEISPLQLVFLRGIIAALIFLPFIILIKNNRNHVFKLLPYGVILGALYFTSYYSQSVGLETISSGRSAFITNLSVIFVPLLSPFFKRGMPSRHDIVSCLIAMGGIYFLTNPLSESGLKIGDFYTLITAIAFSFQVHILQHAYEKNPMGLIYAFWQVAFIAIFASIFMPIAHVNITSMPSSTMGIIALIYLGVIAMVLTTWLQTRYQGYTTPERAAVIYIVEPVFACIFGYILLNETMTIANLIGGLLIIIAVFWNYIIKFIKSYRIRRT